MDKIYKFFIVSMICNLLYFCGIESYIIRPKQPFPLITYYEFPFVLEYEKNDKICVIEDTLVCEFEGYQYSMVDWAKPRIWKSYLKSGNQNIILFKNDKLEIFYSVNINPNATGAVYMGDKHVYTYDNKIFPNAWCRKVGTDDIYIISSKQLYDKFKIKLINHTSISGIDNIFITWNQIYLFLSFIEVLLLIILESKKFEMIRK